MSTSPGAWAKDGGVGAAFVMKLDAAGAVLYSRGFGGQGGCGFAVSSRIIPAQRTFLSRLSENRAP